MVAESGFAKAVKSELLTVEQKGGGSLVALMVAQMEERRAGSMDTSTVSVMGKISAGTKEYEWVGRLDYAMAE